MSDHEEEIKLLKAEIELLKKELAENRKNDEKRHKEIREIQKEHHQDNLHWNKIGAIGGAFGTPLALILPLIITWINKKPKQEKNKDQEIEKKLNRILELLDKK